ncbi:DUF5677 domain-containing protein [Mycobacterium gordonae]|nr:DUF5677 domain-containing protein [Mycobacterium gordonae]
MSAFVDLTDYWKSEQAENSHIGQEKLNIIAMLHTNDVVANALNRKHKKKDDQLKSISMFFFTHGNELLSGIYFNCKYGFGTSSLVLCRALLEGLIEFSYLYFCKRINKDDKERSGWLQYRAITKLSMHNQYTEFKKSNADLGFYRSDELFDSEVISALEGHADDFKKTFFKHSKTYSWAREPTLVKRARAVDKIRVFESDFHKKLSLEEEYIIMYKHSSELVHGQSGSTLSYAHDDGDSTMNFGPSNNNIYMSVGASCNYMLVYLYLFNKVHHLNIDIMGQLKHSGFVGVKGEN